MGSDAKQTWGCHIVMDLPFNVPRLHRLFKEACFLKIDDELLAIFHCKRVTWRLRLQSGPSFYDWVKLALENGGGKCRRKIGQATPEDPRKIQHAGYMRRLLWDA